MKKDSKNVNSTAGRIIEQLAVEKKKAAVALSLIGLMLFMWVRVLTKSGPDAADAAALPQQADSGQQGSDAPLAITYMELPKIPGRNDALTRDFFDSDRWRHFRDAQGRSSSGDHVNVVSPDGTDQIARRVAAKLRFLSISTGNEPQAYINDMWLSVGDMLTIREGVSTYVCEVAAIRDSSVYLRCGEAEIHLKLTQTNQTAN